MISNAEKIKFGQYVCLSGLLVTFFCYFATAIWDSDFWWHIAAGRWIVESGMLPSVDPFQVYLHAELDSAFGSDTIRSDTVLKGQWLGQVILYEIYNIFSAQGVILFRAGLLVVCLYFVFVRARALQASIVSCWIIVTLAGLISLGFTNDRPQLFSYIFAVIIFVLLERFEQGLKAKWLLLIPVIGLFWANIHGAFILLVVLLLLYVVVYCLQSIAKHKSLNGNAKWLIVIFVLFMLATLASPNGITTYLYLFDLQGSQLQTMTSEYKSSLKLYQLGYVLPQVWVGLIYMLALVSITGLFRAPPARLIILLFLAIISLVSYRYFAFFIFIAGPYIAQGITLVMAKYKISRNNTVASINKYSGVFFLIASLFFLGFGIKNSWIFQNGVDETMFPVVATEQMKEQGLQGKVFNAMQWGGYLIWHLSPKISNYIDGRVLDYEKIPPYTNIIWATPPGLEVFNGLKFNFVMMPIVSRFTGERYKLNDYLLQRNDWKVLYKDNRMYLFQYISQIH